MNTTQGCYYVLRFLWATVKLPFKIILFIFRITKKQRRVNRQKYVPQPYHKHENDPISPDVAHGYNDYDDLDELLDLLEPECPEFIQYFPITDEIGIGLEDIKWCPDETAIIRVCLEDEITKPYKKKIYSDNMGRYFKVNNCKYYLRQKKGRAR